MRRCILRETGREYAVKIIDMHVDEAVRQSIVAEIDVLTQLPSHKHISMCVLHLLWVHCVVHILRLLWVYTVCGTLCLPGNVFLLLFSLQYIYRTILSHHHFLVFELCVHIA